MLYLDDRLPTHPKILKAGARLGEGGASQALHLYLLGITYARQNHTDGFVPNAFVLSCGVVSKSGSIAKVLANRTIRLWRKVRGGYQIHDYHKYNPTAKEEREKREFHRQKMARWRQAKAKARDGVRDAVVTSYPDPDPDPVLRVQAPTLRAGSLTLVKKTRRPERPSFALACVVMREAFTRSWLNDHDVTVSAVGEWFKTLCAQRGLAYDSDLVRRAYDAVLVAHARRYGT